MMTTFTERGTTTVELTAEQVLRLPNLVWRGLVGRASVTKLHAYFGILSQVQKTNPPTSAIWIRAGECLAPIFSTLAARQSNH